MQNILCRRFTIAAEISLISESPLPSGFGRGSSSIFSLFSSATLDKLASGGANLSGVFVSLSPLWFAVEPRDEKNLKLSGGGGGGGGAFLEIGGTPPVSGVDVFVGSGGGEGMQSGCK